MCYVPAPVVEVVDTGLSDHFLLLWPLPTVRPPPPAVETVVRRPWRSLDIDQLRSALAASPLCQPDCWQNIDVNALALLYDSELTTLLDRLVPAKSFQRRPRRRIRTLMLTAVPPSGRHVVWNALKETRSSRRRSRRQGFA